MSNETNGEVFYFAYGSNLLSKRMHINIKSAVKYANGLLKGYKLGFSGYANFWKGSTANIVPLNDSIVWGVIWTVSASDLQLLDKQEVGYNAIDVNVYVNGSQQLVSCKTYVQKAQYTMQCINPDQSSTQEDCISSIDCQIPSAAYKSVIIKGAVEQNLPEDYIETTIKSHADNGILNCGPPDLL